MFKKLRLRFLEAHLFLRKWRTNDSELRNRIKETLINPDNNSKETLPTNNETLPSENAETNIEKILGIPWDDEKDVFVYDFSELVEVAKTLKPTKRNTLKILASFYYTLGMIQPILSGLKILLQEVHKVKIGWDEVLPDELRKEWERSLSEIKEMGCVEVDRRFEEGCVDDPVTWRELHGFSDASQQGYGACIYVQSIHKSGKVTAKLLTSKARVSPLKSETIPRLELLGNLLLSRLVKSVKNALSKNTEFHKTYLWTDSQITLAWIRATQNEYKTFVENRI